MFNKSIILLISLLFLTACGTKTEPYVFSDAQRVKPYTVRGERYYPLLNADGFVEVGHASWYGPGFDGKLTANGETFDEDDMTAAHKFLPLGVYVYVKHLDNGNIIRVKVNDRGPFIDDRIIDLSKGAAKKIGMYEAGVANVVVASDKDDLDAKATFIASRDNNQYSTRFKSSTSSITPIKNTSSSSSSASKNSSNNSSSFFGSILGTSAATATTSTSTTPKSSASANSSTNTSSWSFISNGKSYYDLRKEKYPESLTSIYTDDGSHPNPSYASTLGSEHSTYSFSENNNSTAIKSNTNTNSTTYSTANSNTNFSEASNANENLSNSSNTIVSSSQNSDYIHVQSVETTKVTGTIFVQLASYTTREEAEEKAKIVHSLGLPTTIKSSNSHTLLSGPYETKKKASNSRAVLQFRFPKAKVL